MHPVTDFLVALQFLTISPSILRRSFSPSEFGRATAFFPLVGALIGTLLWLINRGLSILMPGELRAALVLTLWILFTGALHLDGFLDSCDGLLGGFTPESRMDIMKDERVGAFAFAGGASLLLIKFTALVALPVESMVLILAPTLGRFSMTIAIFAFPYARPQGLGRAMKDYTTGWQFFIAILIAGVVGWFSSGWLGLALLAVAIIATWLIARFCLKRIPGLTGDNYGAIDELVELVVLVMYVVAIHARWM